jgi:signal recognition particle subunit SRP54
LVSRFNHVATRTINAGNRKKTSLPELMGGDAAGINLSGNPTVILNQVYKVQKTTFSENLPPFKTK